MKSTIKTVIGVFFALAILAVIGLALFNSGVKNLDQLRNRISHAAKAETYLMRVDSLEAENAILKQSFDSLVNVSRQAEARYKIQLSAQQDRMKQYKQKVTEYEARIHDINGMSYSALLDSIAGYYGRRIIAGR